MYRQCSVLLISLAAAITLGGSVFAQAAPLGTITAYKADALRVYDQAGVRQEGLRARADLPAPPTAIVAFGVGGQLGVRSGGTTIYLRGIDVDFTLTQAGRDRSACSQVSAGVRASGAVVAGPRAGGGSSDDCRVAGTNP